MSQHPPPADGSQDTSASTAAAAVVTLNPPPVSAAPELAAPLASASTSASATAIPPPQTSAAILASIIPSSSSSSSNPHSPPSSSSLSSYALRRPPAFVSPAPASLFVSGIPPPPSSSGSSAATCSSSFMSAAQRLAGVTTPTTSRVSAAPSATSATSARAPNRLRTHTQPIVPSTRETAVGSESSNGRRNITGSAALTVSERPVREDGRSWTLPAAYPEALPLRDTSITTNPATPTSASASHDTTHYWHGTTSPFHICRLPFCPLHPARRLNHHQSPRTHHSSTSRNNSSSWAWASQQNAAGKDRHDRSKFREESVIAFSWSIADLRLLRDEVESAPPGEEEGRSVSAGAGISDVWTSHPVFGDGKWKLELFRMARSTYEDIAATEVKSAQESTSAQGSDRQNTINVLSLFITSMVIDYASTNVTIPTQLFIGIHPSTSRNQRNSLPASLSSPDWVWSHSKTFTFGFENEFYHCSDLPSISELLANQTIARDDALELVVQIGTGPHVPKGDNSVTDQGMPQRAALPFHVPDGRFVPDSLLQGLESLVDCAATGDLALVVQERGVVLGSPGTPGTMGYPLEVIPWPVGMPLPTTSKADTSTEIVVRDRVLWAHTSILRSRSDYFRTMLASDFAEGGSDQTGHRTRILRIDGVDYATVQGLLRYLYTAKVDFMREEDIRSVALDESWLSQAEAWSSSPDTPQHGAASRAHRPLVWAWRSLAQLEADLAESEGAYDYGSNDAHVRSAVRSVSASSSHRLVDTRSPQVASPKSSMSRPHLSPPSSPSTTLASERFASRSLASSASQAFQADNVRSPVCGSSSSNINKTNRHSSHGDSNADEDAAALANDQHPHPAPLRERTSSALATYKLCHRYGQIDLLSLAKHHLLSNLCQDSAFPTLLATASYPELQRKVEKFVLEHAEGVLASEEFERCCDEVSSGEWGADAGRTLKSLMRSMMNASSSSSSSSTPTTTTTTINNNNNNNGKAKG